MTGVRMETVVSADDGLRLDRWFKQHFPQLRHGQLQKMLRKGQVRVDGGRAKTDFRLTTGAVVRVPPLDDNPEPAVRPKARLSTDDAEFVRDLVLYQDDHILALNKPAGLAVQGGKGQSRHIDGLLDAFIGRDGERPRLVHRLDRDTGGVLVLGKTRKSAAFLAEAFRQHTVQKIYWALTRGIPSPAFGRIDLAISKSGPQGRERMSPSPSDGKRAITDFQVIETAGQKAAFVALRPTTGRTHQIRVHLAQIGTPIVGDRKYGSAHAMLEGLPAQMHLFCRQMTVPRPGNKPITITAPLTYPMAESWALFSFEQPDDLEWPE